MPRLAVDQGEAAQLRASGMTSIIPFGLTPMFQSQRCVERGGATGEGTEREKIQLTVKGNME